MTGTTTFTVGFVKPADPYETRYRSFMADDTPERPWLGDYILAKAWEMRCKGIQHAYKHGGVALLVYFLRLDRNRYLAQEAKAAAARSSQARGGHRRWAMHWRRSSRDERAAIRRALPDLKLRKVVPS